MLYIIVDHISRRKHYHNETSIMYAVNSDAYQEAEQSELQLL